MCDCHQKVDSIILGLCTRRIQTINHHHHPIKNVENDDSNGCKWHFANDVVHKCNSSSLHEDVRLGYFFFFFFYTEYIMNDFERHTKLNLMRTMGGSV